jgi:hypothetical protein
MTKLAENNPQGTANIADDRVLAPVLFSITDRVQIKEGITKWMKEHNYWLEDMGQSIDNMFGQIVNDYSYLPNNDCHFSINIGFDFRVGCIRCGLS